MKIEFIDVGGTGLYPPVPASACLPDWYKKTPSCIDDGPRTVVDGETPHTIKKCVPVFDALTAGYILRTGADVQVTHRDGVPYYEWPSGPGVDFHPIKQAPLHPRMNGAPFPKFINTWVVKTPPGYSSLVVPPLHNPNGFFTALPGLVDTDTYSLPMNCPFTLDDLNWEGIIPAGTPMVQVIPIKREPFKMQASVSADYEEATKSLAKLRSLWFNSYKRQFWSRKEYR